uniref:FAD-binding FR-type domain-containing protein n=1 Tax=Podarcis muralis TaxID=64176 RepID=A0A670JYL0_PODMU
MPIKWYETKVISAYLGVDADYPFYKLLLVSKGTNPVKAATVEGGREAIVCSPQATPASLPPALQGSVKISFAIPPQEQPRRGVLPMGTVDLSQFVYLMNNICFLGPYICISFLSLSFFFFAGLFSKKKVPDNYSKEAVPSYDWFQTDGSITVVIYTKQKDMNSELVIADLQERKLRGELIVKDYSYLLHLVQVSEKVGKVEFVLKKKEILSWKKLGQPLESHNSFVKRTERGLYYRKCRLLSKTNVSHDTQLFCLALPLGTHLLVPVGHHVYLRQTITGTEIVKPYTPVPSFLVSTFKNPCHDDQLHIFFIIKIYPSGLFTPVLDALQIGKCLLSFLFSRSFGIF